MIGLDVVQTNKHVSDPMDFFGEEFGKSRRNFSSEVNRTLMTDGFF